MTLATLIWGAPAWLLPATLLTVAALLLAAWSYRRSPSSAATRILGVLLKTLGVLLLAACLAEPLLSSVRPRAGANLFAVLADNSQSLSIRDSDVANSRGDQLRELLHADAPWQTRLAQDFDVRRYAFDARLKAVDDFGSLASDGVASTLVGSLDNLTRRYHDRPLAGILLLTDGNATDLGDAPSDWSRLPPVYPVVLGDDASPRDVSLTRVSVSQTSFEDAPVSVQADIVATGCRGERLLVELLDEAGKQVDEQQTAEAVDGVALKARFQLRSEQPGVSFYQVRVAPAGERGALEQPARSREATFANNRQLVTVDRGAGPYRVLYVAGRPNWEYKFLRRAIEQDPQVQLVALLRIARREPKFDFRGRTGESSNPLFRGFNKPGEEVAETYDKPVLVRLGAEDAEELRDGFPKTTEELYRYHAIIVDDLEAEFFTPDQMALVQKFVSQRGGGFLMLGGQESLAGGNFGRTPIGDLLPVYLDRLPELQLVPHRLALEREGMLQPWIRLRSTEPDEQRRLDAMPQFQTLNRVRSLKPGAVLLASAVDDEGRKSPGMAEQRFGKGRAIAMMIGDLWRWGLQPSNSESLNAQDGDLAGGEPNMGNRLDGQTSATPRKSDLDKAWRQTIRWLVADVPERIEVEPVHEHDDASQPVRLQVLARDAKFEPLDNASVVVKVTSPGGETLELTAAAGDERPGFYSATYAPRQPGAYRAEVVVTGPDGAEIGRRATGWTSDPAAAEFRAVRPNRELLERIARETGGQVVSPADLTALAADLPNMKAPITEPSITPLWHQSWVFLLAIACLCAEWGLRRWRGLP